VDEPTETTSNTPVHPQFKLTPLPGAATSEAGPQGGRRKSGRRLLIGSSAAVPFVLTISSRPAFAKGTCTVSFAMSAPTSGETGNVTPCGNSVTYWQTEYPICELLTKLPFQTVTNLLQNPSFSSLSSSTIASPTAFIGGTLTFTVPNLSTALTTGPALVVKVTIGSNNASTTADPGGKAGFWANAAAALLNAATYGSTAGGSGQTDTGIVGLLNTFFNNTLVSNANSNSPSVSAIAAALNTAITNEISTLLGYNSYSNP